MEGFLRKIKPKKTKTGGEDKEEAYEIIFENNREKSLSPHKSPPTYPSAHFKRNGLKDGKYSSLEVISEKSESNIEKIKV